MELDYFTRDGKGNDFVKKVAIKEFPIESVDFECPVCHRLYHWILHKKMRIFKFHRLGICWKVYLC